MRCLHDKGARWPRGGAGRSIGPLELEPAAPPDGWLHVPLPLVPLVPVGPLDTPAPAP